MTYKNNEIFWHRVTNLYKMYETATDPDFKRIWMDKLQELMRKFETLDKRTIN